MMTKYGTHQDKKCLKTLYNYSIRKEVEIGGSRIEKETKSTTYCEFYWERWR